MIVPKPSRLLPSARVRRQELAFAGMRIGVFGGTFNPAHEGHAHVAEVAQKRLGLDKVWWLVTPQNPLKSPRGARPLAARMLSAAAMAQGPSMLVSDLESRWGLSYTAQTIEALKRRYPGVRFYWIMGADNALGFHRWRDWRVILQQVPCLIVARPGAGAKARLAKAVQSFAGARVSCQALRVAHAPAIAFAQAPLVPASSTALRAIGRSA
jgi:nicotinate-nucleotide adenylyltransferase